MASVRMTHDPWLVSLLVKLAVMASIASILARSNRFKSILLQDNRSMDQRLELSLWLSVFFAASSAARILGKTAYQGADLGLEGSLLAGIIGGYVTGLVSGILISLPAFIFAGGYATMPLLAGIGVLGGVLRDIAPGPDEIWRFTPLFDLNIIRFFRSHNPRISAFHLLFAAAILFSEFIRQSLGSTFGDQVFYIRQDPVSNSWL